MRDVRRHWLTAVQEMMRQTRLPFRECCKRVGTRGGQVAAAQQRGMAKRRLREEAQGLR
jgi:hypothetical protein